MEKKKSTYFLVFLILILFLINYNTLDQALINFLDESEMGVVERIIDGDTIKVANESVRLLGINSPERGELYYDEATKFLESFILNKTVRLEFSKEKYDKYSRKLSYIYLGGINVNLESVRQGFSNPYFPSGKDKHYNDFWQAWKECLESNKNLCKKSETECANCIILRDFDYKEEIIKLYNQCGFECDLTNWEIKGGGRKKFALENLIINGNQESEIRIYEEIFTDIGDSLFLRDPEGGLVLWESY